MILLGLGSNMPGTWGEPLCTVQRAVVELEARGVRIERQSRWYRSAPFGRIRQPAFVNGVVMVATHLPPHALLSKCHAIERLARRERRRRWGPRTLDIDLLAYHDVIIRRDFSDVPSRLGGRLPLTLPHPGIALRPFVLVPISEIAPFWHHPVTGRTAHQMLAALGSRTQGEILETL